MRVNGYYNVNSIFDMSMTYGNKPYPILEIKPELMDKAIKELERLSPVNIVYQNEGVVGYDAEQRALCVPTCHVKSRKCWHDCPPKLSLQPQSSVSRVSPKSLIAQDRYGGIG